MSSNVGSSRVRKVSTQHDLQRKRPKTGYPFRPKPARPQQSRLLAMPMEIKQKIYDCLFSAWSLAIFESPGHHQAHQLQKVQEERDNTVFLKLIDSKMVSGPPGSDLMLTCRDIYYSVRKLYGTNFTQKLIIGHLKSTVRSTLGLCITRQRILSNWYQHVRHLSVSLDLEIQPSTLRMQDYFPNLQTMDVLVFTPFSSAVWILGPPPGQPIHRFWNTVLYGVCDLRCSQRVNKTVHDFLGIPHLFPLIHPLGHHPSNIVNVKLVLVQPGWERTLGFHFRWQGTDVKTITRAIRGPSQTSYCTDENGLGVHPPIFVDDIHRDGEPEELQWVREENRRFWLG